MKIAQYRASLVDAYAHFQRTQISYRLTSATSQRGAEQADDAAL